MKTSREQFEEAFEELTGWESDEYPDANYVDDMWTMWQESRQCIEVDTTWPCGDGENDDSEYTQGYNDGIIATQNRIVKAGIKVKGA